MKPRRLAVMLCGSGGTPWTQDIFFITICATWRILSQNSVQNEHRNFYSPRKWSLHVQNMNLIPTETLNLQATFHPCSPHTFSYICWFRIIIQIRCQLFYHWTKPLVSKPNESQASCLLFWQLFCQINSWFDWDFGEPVYAVISNISCQKSITATIMLYNTLCNRLASSHLNSFLYLIEPTS